MFPTATIPSRKVVRLLVIWAAVPLLNVFSAQAGPFKQNMQRLGQTTKAVKAELSAFDAGNAAALLQRYVEEAREGEALSVDPSAKSKDLHARFARLASTAQAAAGSVTNAAQLRTAFVAIAVQCKSCHSVYK